MGVEFFLISLLSNRISTVYLRAIQINKMIEVRSRRRAK